MELDFQYSSEGIHKRWDGGFRITACAATPDQAAFVLSVPRRRPMDETQETLRTSAFPSTHVKVRRASTQRVLRSRRNVASPVDDAHDTIGYRAYRVYIPYTRSKAPCVDDTYETLLFSAVPQHTFRLRSFDEGSKASEREL